LDGGGQLAVVRRQVLDVLGLAVVPREKTSPLARSRVDLPTSFPAGRTLTPAPNPSMCAALANRPTASTLRALISITPPPECPALQP
jgi:hypothetical protein